MATVKDVAKLIGVFPASVSRVLSGDPSFRISSTLAKAIIEAARSLDYRSPRMRAYCEARVIESSETIGIAAPAFDCAGRHDEHLSKIRVGIERRCAELGLKTTDILIDDFREATISFDIAGAILIGGLAPNEVECVASTGLPIVISDWKQDDSRFDCVYADFSASVNAVLKSVQPLERKDIRYIGTAGRGLRVHLTSAQVRLHAYLDFLQQPTTTSQRPGLRFAATATNFEVGYSEVKEILSSGVRPDVIVVEDDNLAVGAYRALGEAGLALVKEVRIISLCGTDLGAFQLSPPTSIDARGLAIGENSVDALLSRIRGRRIAREVVLFAEPIPRTPLT